MPFGSHRAQLEQEQRQRVHFCGTSSCPSFGGTSGEAGRSHASCWWPPGDKRVAWPACVTHTQQGWEVVVCVMEVSLLFMHVVSAQHTQLSPEKWLVSHQLSHQLTHQSRGTRTCLTTLILLHHLNNSCLSDFPCSAQ